MDHNLLGSAAAIATIVGTIIAVFGLALPIFVRRRAKRVKARQEAIANTSRQDAANSNQINISNNINIVPPQDHAAKMSTSAAPVTKTDRVHQGPAEGGAASKNLPKPRRVKTLAEERHASATDVVHAMSDTVKYAYEVADAYERAMRNEDRLAARHSVLLALGKALTYLQRSNERATNLVGALRDLYTSIARLQLVFEGEDPRDVLLTYLDPLAATPRERSVRDMLEVFTSQVERVADALEREGFSVLRTRVSYKVYQSYSLEP